MVVKSKEAEFDIILLKKIQKHYTLLNSGFPNSALFIYFKIYCPARFLHL